MPDLTIDKAIEIYNGVIDKSLDIADVDNILMHLQNKIEQECEEKKQKVIHMNTRKSDEQLLIQFAKDQGFDLLEVILAAERLEQCIKKGLQDYCCDEKL